MFGSIDPILLLASLMVAATPILLAAIGELVVERAGVLNLGVEGMMISGSVLGFVAAISTGNPWIGFLAAAVGGAGMALVFGILTQFLLSNQVATGLALTLFGLGLASLIGQGYLGVRAPAFPDWHIPLLGDIPVIGPIVFQHDPMVYVGLTIVAGVWWFLQKSRAGLVLRAVGENHEAAHALGYHVVRTRLLAIMFGGACAGLGGAYLSIVRVPTYADGLTAGAGWIALAIVVFASWKPLRLLLGAYLFGGVTVLQLNLQAAGLPLLSVLPWILVATGVIMALYKIALHRSISKSSAKAIGVTFGIAALVYFYGWMGWSFNDALWLSASPYIATIVVLVIMSAGGAPGSLGKTFHASR
ncbi:ABC transporter permease [Octadecabacter sp. 1_MG-2023]|uniref:ABC transporter permease n=1 Tax=unclassified Octadecabacter TaxID=196158 RepID=UPI001C080331|nr:MULTISPECIES: ABC transporter permease [unclassified Octadecabacter]MBU2991850.1 ABC transporter permease [Octadecabacter sp. B2R22]MDO6735824.1 ABC transporter permease [Octadecabacter sp. 1_MG-2023]